MLSRRVQHSNFSCTQAMKRYFFCIVAKKGNTQETGIEYFSFCLYNWHSVHIYICRCRSSSLHFYFLIIKSETNIINIVLIQWRKTKSYIKIEIYVQFITLLLVSFAVLKCFSLMQSLLFIFSFISLAQGAISEKNY